MSERCEQTELDAILFLDVNVKSVRECQPPKCETKKHIFCKHRFYFNFKWFREEGLIRFIRPFDHQVILYCLGLMYKYRWVGDLARRGRFFLITCDQNFLRDAQNEWDKRAHHNTSPKLNFSTDRVTIGKLEIIIKTISCQKKRHG